MRSTCLGALVFGTAVCVVGQPFTPHPLMSEYDRAWHLADQKSAGEAISMLRDLIARDPGFHRAYGALAAIDQLFYAGYPGAICRHVHVRRLENDCVLAFLFKVQHNFAGTRRGVSGRLEAGEHFFCCAIEIDADADSGGELYLNILKSLDRADRNLWCGIFVAHQNSAHDDGRFNLQLPLQALIIARETDEVDFSCRVFKSCLGIEFLIALTLLYTKPNDHSGNLDIICRVRLLAPGSLRRLALKGLGSGNDSGEIVQLLGVFIERMAADEEAKHFLFVGEPLAFFPVGYAGQVVVALAWGGGFVEQPKEAGLSVRSVFLRFLRALHCLVDGGHQRCACTERIERAGLDERLDDALVHYAQVDFFAELPEALEAAADFLAGLHDGLDCVAADVFHGGKAKSNCLTVRRELLCGDLHIGRLYADSNFAALADVLDDTFGL